MGENPEKLAGDVENMVQSSDTGKPGRDERGNRIENFSEPVDI